ncbi:hypothetical protein BC826DRAFT_1022803 [Russula brevipes]|nr:hypothetical protein BC826DRAFT_1022803 [Russula brevipes]
MLHKPLVSLAMTFAVASSVAAFATPVRRGGGGGYRPPPAPIPTSPCDAGSPHCCDMGSPHCCETYTSSRNSAARSLVERLALPVGPSTGIGQGCVPIASGVQCSNTQMCCVNTVKDSLVNLACVPVNVNA